MLAGNAAGMEGDPTSFSTESGRQVSGCSGLRTEGNPVAQSPTAQAVTRVQAIDASAVGCLQSVVRELRASTA